jgi:hypothetical protein
MKNKKYQMLFIRKKIDVKKKKEKKKGGAS